MPNHVARLRNPIIIALAVGLGFALSTFGAQGDELLGTFFGCLSPGGTLTKVVVSPAGPPVCSPNATAVTWNQIGPAGPAGLPGEAGPQGPQGPAGTANMTLVTGQRLSTGDVFGLTATCPAGDAVTGGGHSITRSTGTGVILYANKPIFNGSSWGWRVEMLANAGETLTVYAVCVPGTMS
jgi:hypothetical protein